MVVCQLEISLETLAWTLEEARRRGAVTLLNPAPVRDDLPDIWRLVDYLTPNEGEAGRLTGMDVRGSRTAAAAAQALRARGVGTVIVTLGAEGVVAGTAQGEIHSRALPVSVVDTTAAGDAFNGALAVALGGGDTLESALRFANAAGGLACTRRGAQPSLPTRAEVDRLLCG